MGNRRDELIRSEGRRKGKNQGCFLDFCLSNVVDTGIHFFSEIGKMAQEIESRVERNKEFCLGTSSI